MPEAPYQAATVREGRPLPDRPRVEAAPSVSCQRQHLQLLACLLCAPFALPHLCSATILVIGIMPGRVIIAADSRVAAPWGIEDTECKIAALDPHTLYAASGITGMESYPFSLYPFLWFARREAIQEFENLGDGNLRQLAEAWAVSAEEHFSAMRLRDWSFGMRAVSDHLTITSGHFARANQDGVEFLSVYIQCLDYPACVAVTHTIAERRVPGILLDGDHGAMAFISQFLNARIRPDDAYALGYLIAAAVRTRRFPDIGEPIDIAEVSADQGVHWYLRKRNCPALQ